MRLYDDPASGVVPVLRRASIKRCLTMVGLTLMSACGGTPDGRTTEAPSGGQPSSEIDARLAKYASVPLTASLDHLAEADRRVVDLLIDAAEHMTPVFWTQAYGDPTELLHNAPDDVTRRFLEINYGPWDRLAGNEPFLPGIGPKPLGANLYPPDLTVEEFEAAAATAPDGGNALRDLYTLVRRDNAGGLVAVPYHEAFADHHAAAAAKLREAADLATDPGLASFLSLRADALMTDDYRASDMAWMDMKDTPIDIVIGPIEVYEDLLFNYKAGHEAYVLIKDLEWSQRLARFAALLPDLQRGLPVPEAYKREVAGSEAELNAYDAVFYAGEANAGSKTIAINLPNDETVQLEKGTRRLQLKNTMRAKFDGILIPIADLLIAEDQRQHVTFDAFFENTMFHEVAHGLGIKNLVEGEGTVREALREHYSPMEEGKADILGLYMVTRLYDEGELTEGDLRDNYVTFLASIFRSARFGASSAHGRANMVRFYFFEEQGAFTRDESTGRYRADFDGMRAAMEELSRLILQLQGDGNYEAAGALLAEKGVVGPAFQADLDRLAALGIPTDLVFEQGKALLGLP